MASDASGSVDVPAFAEVGVTGSGPVSLRLGSGADEQLVYSGAVAAGEELRIFIDASLVEVYRSGSVATTLRAYPLAGESWTLELPAGATANVWELTLPR